MHTKKGFTLIELMVVISIITILVFLIVYFVSDAKKRGADAGIKSNLHTIKTQAELFYLENKNNYIVTPNPGSPQTAYATYCDDPFWSASFPRSMWVANQTMKNALAEALKHKGGTGGSNSSRCLNYPNAWAISIVLKTSPLSPVKYWCVDSSGQAKVGTGAVASSISLATLKCI